MDGLPSIAFSVAEEDNFIRQLREFIPELPHKSELIRAYLTIWILILEVLPVADNSPCYNIGEFQSFYLKDRFHSADAEPNFRRNTMPSLCYKINGQKHCFEIPTLVDLSHIHGPGPVNFPQLELAVTVIGLVQEVEKTGRKSEFGAKLLDVSNTFLQEVRKGLPQGVELTEDRPQATQAKSA